MALENPTYQQPFVDLVKLVKPKTILEIGYGYGQSSYVWLSETKAKVTSVDIDEIEHLDNPRLTYIHGNSHDILPTLKGPYDLIYIDGSHAYDDIRQDIIDCQKLGKFILVDDYGVDGGEFGDEHRQYGVKRACDELFEDWEQAHQDIDFANGARVYVKT